MKRVRTGPNGRSELRSALPPIADHKFEAGGCADEWRGLVSAGALSHCTSIGRFRPGSRPRPQGLRFSQAQLLIFDALDHISQPGKVGATAVNAITH